MGRLIEEEAVYEYLSNKFNEFDISIFRNEFAGKILDGLGDIPTAYDVEKVVAELEEAKEIVKEYEEFYYSVRLDKAIDIVKAGGINE